MRTILILASAAITSAAIFTGPAAAEERLHLTPPLYRDQARTAQQVRSVGDLSTTPQPVSGQASRQGTRPMIQAAADALR